MDLTRLRRGEAIAAGSAIALFVVMFFSWYGLDSDIAGPIGEAEIKRSGVDTTADAWYWFEILDVFLVFVIAAALGLAAVPVARVSVAFPVGAGVVTTALGLLASLLVLYRIVNQPGDNSVIAVKFGAWLGFLCCVGIFIGGFLSMRDEGASLDAAAAQAPDAAGARTTTRPAPPADGGDPPVAASPSASPAEPPRTADRTWPADPPRPADPPWPVDDPVLTDDDPAHHPDPGEGHGTQPPHGDPLR
jgi:hypothetical protein